MSEEMDTLKRNVGMDMEQRVLMWMQQVKQEQGRLEVEVQSVKDEIMTIKNMEGGKMERVEQETEERVRGMRAENRKLWEKARGVMEGNS